MGSTSDDDWRLTLQMAIAALTEATKTMATVSAETQRQAALFIGHEKLCEVRQEGTAKALDQMAVAVRQLAETVQKNAETAASDRSALSRRLAEAADKAAAHREEDQKAAILAAAQDKSDAIAARRWLYAFILLCIGTASGLRWLFGS